MSNGLRPAHSGLGRAYNSIVPTKQQVAIRAMEVEAAMNEEQAKRFADLASLMGDSDHKKKLEALSREATEKAVQLRQQVRFWHGATYHV